MTVMGQAQGSDAMQLSNGAVKFPNDEHRNAIDLAGIEDAYRKILVALGRDLTSEGLADTPRRAARALAEMTTPRPFSLTTFPNDDDYSGLVLARDIPVRSLCEHHLLPFYGVAHVGYIPGERLLGLSKFARVVDHFARGLQIQERLTSQVARWLQHGLSPRGVGVIVEAEHLCMAMRGVRVMGSRTVTCATHGALLSDRRLRGEFMSSVGVANGE